MVEMGEDDGQDPRALLLLSKRKLFFPPLHFVARLISRGILERTGFLRSCIFEVRILGLFVMTLLLRLAAVRVGQLAFATRSLASFIGSRVGEQWVKSGRRVFQAWEDRSHFAAQGACAGGEGHGWHSCLKHWFKQLFKIFFCGNFSFLLRFPPTNLRLI